MDRRPENLDQLKEQLIKLSKKPDGISLALVLFNNSSRLMETATEFKTTEPARSFLDEILKIGFETLTNAPQTQRWFLIKRLRTAIRAALGDVESVATELIQPHGLEINKIGRLTHRSDHVARLYRTKGPQGGPSLDKLYQQLVTSNLADLLGVFDANISLMLEATTFTPSIITTPISKLLNIGFQNLSQQHIGEGRLDYIRSIRKSLELVISGNKEPFILENLLGGAHRRNVETRAKYEAEASALADKESWVRRERDSSRRVKEHTAKVQKDEARGDQGRLSVKNPAYTARGGFNSEKLQPPRVGQHGTVKSVGSLRAGYFGYGKTNQPPNGLNQGATYGNHGFYDFLGRQVGQSLEEPPQ